MEKIVEVKPFRLVGISIRTTNEDGKSAQDLGALWQKFYSEGVIGKVENALSSEVYSVYTEYESDYRAPYTAFLGVKIPSDGNAPEGLKVLDIAGGKYIQQTISGDPQQAVTNAWVDIWARDESLNRRYTADFEVYGEKSQQGPDSEVQLFLAVS